MLINFIKNKYLGTSIEFLLLSLFVILIPISQTGSTLVLGLLMIVIIFKCIKEKNISSVKVNIRFPIILPIIYFLLNCLSLLYSNIFHFKFIEQKASFLVIPLVFILIRLTKEQKRELFILFVLGCAIASLLALINAFHNSIGWEDGSIFFQASLNPEFSFWYSIVRDGNFFFSTHFSIFHDPLYFSLYLNIALAIILSFSLWRRHRLYLFLLVLFPFIVFLISSKLGIACCFLVFIANFIGKVKSKYLEVIVIITLIIIGFLALKSNPRGMVMLNRFTSQGLTFSPEERYGYSLRLMSWGSAVELIKEYPILGVGTADAQNELENNYRLRGYIYPLKYNLNVHNQFLQTYLELGLLGFVVLNLMMYTLINRMSYQKNSFRIFFFFLILSICLVESIFNRYSGLSVFLFFYCIMVTHHELKG